MSSSAPTFLYADVASALAHQNALGLQDAFRCLQPQAREFTHTATNNASSARIDRWLVSDSLLPNVSAASVTDLILSDHYGVAITVSPSNAPPRGPGLSSMPPAIISHPAFKTHMTAQIQTFLHANPVTTTLSRAARWDQLKVHIQDVVRGYCFTFQGQRTEQLKVLRVRASQAHAAFVAAPGSQHGLQCMSILLYMTMWLAGPQCAMASTTQKCTCLSRTPLHSTDSKKKKINFFFLGGRDIHYTKQR